MLKKTFHLACLGGLLLGAGSCPALAASDIAILMPDAPLVGTDPVNAPLAQAWLDAINEEGFNADVIRDSQFATVAANYKAVILPDSVHQQASATLVDDVKAYVNNGGKVMIVYDFGALDSNGLFPAAAPNPFSSLVGVDYNLYGELYGQSTITPVGLGPVYGMESKLWSLQVPPGKYMLWPATSTATATTTAFSATSPDAIPTAYLKTSTSNPGGTQGYNAGYIHKVKPKNGDTLTQTQINTAQGKKIPKTALIGSKPNRKKQDPVSYVPGDALQGVSGYLYGFLTYPAYVTCNLGHTGNIATTPENCTGTGQPYNGTSLLASDRFGLVAGTSIYGSGSVLFVNLPLSYLKSQTDGMLMHGFIRYFGDTILHRPRLSSVPNGIPGMTVNVHVDSQDAIDPVNQMNNAGIWKEGPFSVHFTGGPVVDYVACKTDDSGNPVKALPGVTCNDLLANPLLANPLGDVVYLRDSTGNLIVDPAAAIGLNIPNNKKAREMISKFDALAGYRVGAHGGWLHNYYGDNAHDDIFDTTGTLVNPSNEATFQPYIPQNKTAVENVVKHATTEYSAPQGNNPKWAVNWLENNGILGMYYLGDTGMGPTRHWREGNLLNQKVWMFPVLPFGLYATFEDFAQFGVNPTDVTTWLNKVVDFSVTQSSTRMVYFHPPGAIGYLPSLTSMLSRAKSYANSLSYNFQWYTMTDLSMFLTNRKQVTWTTTPQTDGSLLFQASHPASLKGQTWILPKAGFSKPVPAASYIDKITIGQDKVNWLVITNSGSSLSFSAKPLPL